MSADADTTNVVPLPLRPPDSEAGPQYASTRPREAEAAPRTPPWVRVQLILSGASVIEPMLALWAEHATSARAYRHWWASVPVWAWGTVHTWALAPAVHFLLWATRSLPRAAFTAVVIITVLWQFHVITL
jgi:hypothetical protein